MTEAPNQTEPIIAGLRRQQANAMIAFMNYKKYHWLTYGPNFRDLHELYEEHATANLETVDEIAERCLMLDGEPISDPAMYLPSASVAPSEGRLTSEKMIAEAIATSETIISELHSDANLAAESGDIGTADLYTRVVQMHQKQRWFLRSLRK